MSFLLSNEQLIILKKNKYEDYVLKCLFILKEDFGFLTKDMGEHEIQIKLRQMLRLASEKYKFKSPKSIFEFAILALEFPVLQNEPLSFEIHEIIFWPDRKDSRKIELIKKKLY
jgi:hypothetical protein